MPRSCMSALVGKGNDEQACCICSNVITTKLGVQYSTFSGTFDLSTSINKNKKHKRDRNRIDSVCRNIISQRTLLLVRNHNGWAMNYFPLHHKSIHRTIALSQVIFLHRKRYSTITAIHLYQLPSCDRPTEVENSTDPVRLNTQMLKSLQ